PASGVTWTLNGIKGSVAPDGTFTPAPDVAEQAGTIKATAGAVPGEARAGSVRPLPWTETFDAYADGASPPGWIIVGTAKTAVGTIDGQKALYKAPDNT